MCGKESSAGGSLGLQSAWLHVRSTHRVCLPRLPLTQRCLHLQVDPEAWPDLKRQLLAVLTSGTRSSKPTIFGMAAEADTSSMR